ncbi:SPOSA6832_00002 [Sporobolomyces salmonicolor]|uniref:Carboxypeptidase n=1 Tax=Sporidiobolus salmonicolor TaxID=5005 RepID=A0A0D6EEY9_SPOSA|nr:SPOSA6832_00002 [Sporobolomyces salmonicolor]
MSAASFFIPSLPGQPADSQVTMYGGHIPSAPVKNGQPDTESDAHLYFFMVRNRHIAETERTLLWFNGGPGCSSFDGSMMEIGPFRLVRGGNGELTEVEGAWNEYANVIFNADGPNSARPIIATVDQPVGTGYAYMETNAYVHDLPEAAQHVVKFMEGFYKVFPEFQNHDTYIAGESYAGQYIPYIASAFLSSRLPVASRLKGLLIGNGWIDPWNQYPAYLDFALQAGVIKAGSDAEARVRKEVARCIENQEKWGKQNVKIHNGVCEGILGSITDSTVQAVNGQNMCVNNYDVRLTDTHPACGMNWPPDLADIHPYLSRDDVKSAFHATRHTGPWVECNGQVGAQFYTPTSRPSVTLLPELLGKVPILMFAGAEDLICNHVGIEKMIEDLEWNGATGFGNVTADEWYVNGKNAGTWTTARNLTYVKILDASHMVRLFSSSDPPCTANVTLDVPIRCPTTNPSPHTTCSCASSASPSSAPRGPPRRSPPASGTNKKPSSARRTRTGPRSIPAAAAGGAGGGAKALGGTALEGLVNASSALVLVLIMLGAFGTFLG